MSVANAVKLYIGNCPSAATTDALRELFAPFGKVVRADALPGRDYGFVHMANKEEAQAAIMSLDGSEYLGRKISVEVSTSKLGDGPRGPGAPRPGGMDRHMGSRGPPRGGGYGGGGRYDNRDYQSRAPGGGRHDGGGRPRDYGSSRGGDRYPEQRGGRDYPGGGGGYTRGGPGGDRDPPPPGPGGDLAYEREMLIMRDPVYRDRLIREYERLLRIDMLDRSRGGGGGGGDSMAMRGRSPGGYAGGGGGGGGRGRSRSPIGHGPGPSRGGGRSYDDGGYDAGHSRRPRM